MNEWLSYSDPANSYILSLSLLVFLLKERNICPHPKFLLLLSNPTYFQLVNAYICMYIYSSQWPFPLSPSIPLIYKYWAKNYNFSLLYWQLCVLKKSSLFRPFNIVHCLCLSSLSLSLRPIYFCPLNLSRFNPVGIEYIFVHFFHFLVTPFWHRKNRIGKLLKHTWNDVRGTIDTRDMYGLCMIWSSCTMMMMCSMFQVLVSWSEVNVFFFPTESEEWSKMEGKKYQGAKLYSSEWWFKNRDKRSERLKRK